MKNIICLHVEKKHPQIKIKETKWFQNLVSEVKFCHFCGISDHYLMTELEIKVCKKQYK